MGELIPQEAIEEDIYRNNQFEIEWCSYCGKYINARIEKTELQTIKWLILIYYCSECNGFIEARRLSTKTPFDVTI